MGAPKKYEHIDFTPPKGVRNAAKRGLELLKIKSAGTPVGWARARDLSKGRKISPQTAKRMFSFFSRHEVDKSSKAWKESTPSDPSKGYVAWMLWGGDPGYSWSRKLVEQMESADKKAKAAVSVSAGVSSVLYHFTSLHNAKNILSLNKFDLAYAEGSDAGHVDDRPYYLSTTRSRIGSYHAENYIGVLFELDGRALMSKYKGGPVDYWGPEFRKAAPSKNEMEDRIWSPDPTIENAAKYISKVHVYFDGKYGVYDSDKRALRSLLILCKRRGLPAFVYPKQKSANLLDEKSAIPLSKIDLSVKDTAPESQRSKSDHVGPWVEMYTKDNKEHLSERALKEMRNLYGFDGFNAFMADVHNMKKGSPALHELVKILRKHDWKLKDFYEQMRKKWT